MTITTFPDIRKFTFAAQRMKEEVFTFLDNEVYSQQ